ncbi:MAG: sulfite exporter TauE/SafE family protein [Clostridiales bacterium]|nr:sulfite exporter TauE/SafE family protein [Clostridiales bacterium]
MQYVLLALAGIVSGVLGGMGMGGGTLLIPLLTIFFSFNQKVSQGLNLISFSAMALIVLFIHIKNKLIDGKVAVKFAIVAVITSIIGAFIANLVNTKILKIAYGALLILVAIFQAVQEIRTLKNKKQK